jgi:hypothetical protein
MRALCLALLVALSSSSAFAESEVSTDLRGLFRSRAYLFHVGSNEAQAFPTGEPAPQALQPFSLELVARPELALQVGEELSGVVTIHSVRWEGLAAQQGARGTFRIDRAYADFTRDRMDLRVGRQALNFGSGLIWNPVDLFDANTPLNFAVEKVGVDAIRLAYSPGSTTRLMGILAMQNGLPITLARAQWVIGSTGLAVMAGDRRTLEEQVIGFDLKGDLVVGYWAEGTMNLPRNGSPYFRMLFGVDYSFPVLEVLNVSAQYYRDTSGGTGIENYDFPSYLAGTRPFLGRQYMSLIGDLGVSEFTSLTSALIFNLDDQSGLAVLGVRRTFLDSVDVSGRLILFDGLSGAGEFNPAEGHPLRNLLSTRTLELLLEWRL